jgi:hypothetical protein
VEGTVRPRWRFALLQRLADALRGGEGACSEWLPFEPAAACVYSETLCDWAREWGVRRSAIEHAAWLLGWRGRVEAGPDGWAVCNWYKERPVYFSCNPSEAGAPEDGPYDPEALIEEEKRKAPRGAMLW